MAVRLQMKLGYAAAAARPPGSPDTILSEEPVDRERRPVEGQPVPRRDLADQRAAGGRGLPARGRGDSRRLLLRRVGRDRGLPREGDPGGQQEGPAPAGPARRRQERRGERTARRRPGRGSGQRAVRRDRGAGRGLPDPAGPPVDPARSEPGPGAALERPRADRLAGRDQRRRFARDRVREPRRPDRPGRAQGRPADAPPPVGDGAGLRPVHHGRRQRQRRGDRDRGDRGVGDQPAAPARARRRSRAPGRHAGSLADPPGRQRDRRGEHDPGVGRPGDRGGRRSGRARLRPLPRPPAPAQAGPDRRSRPPRAGSRPSAGPRSRSWPSSAWPSSWSEPSRSRTSSRAARPTSARSPPPSAPSRPPRPTSARSPAPGWTWSRTTGTGPSSS